MPWPPAMPMFNVQVCKVGFLTAQSSGVAAVLRCPVLSHPFILSPPDMGLLGLGNSYTAEPPHPAQQCKIVKQGIWGGRRFVFANSKGYRSCYPVRFLSPVPISSRAGDSHHLSCLQPRKLRRSSDGPDWVSFPSTKLQVLSPFVAL